jgi:hypothetical protein
LVCGTMVWPGYLFLACISIANSFSYNAKRYQTVGRSFLTLSALPENEKKRVFSIAAAKKTLNSLLVGTALLTGSPLTLPAHAIDPSSLKQYTQTPGAGVDS